MFKSQLSKLSTIHGRNALFAIMFATLAAFGGSVVVVLFIVSAYSGLYLLLKHRKRAHLTSDYWLIIPGLVYITTMLASLIGPDFELDDLEDVPKLLLHLGVGFALINYRYVLNANYFTLFIKYAPYGGYMVLPWLVVQGLLTPERMAGGAGNAIPFALICCFFASIGLLGIIGAPKRQQVISVIGISLLVVALALSQTRSLYLAMGVNLGIVFIYAILKSKHRLRTLGISFLALSIGVGILASSNTVLERGNTLITVAKNIASGQMPEDRASRERVGLYTRGMCLFSEKPIFGYGYGNREDILRQGDQIGDGDENIVCPMAHIKTTHFHNGFLTAAVDAGIIGVLAVLLLLFSPILFVLRSPSDEYWRLRMAYACILVNIYFFMAMFNIVFGHDLIDGIFVIACLFLALSVVKTDGYGIEDVNENLKRDG